MSNKTGGPAFPTPSGWNSHGEWVEAEAQAEGMTLRDYFAAKAMQGMLANPDLKDSVFQGVEHGFLEKSAWAIADAMIKERNT